MCVESIIIKSKHRRICFLDIFSKGFVCDCASVWCVVIVGQGQYRVFWHAIANTGDMVSTMYIAVYVRVGEGYMGVNHYWGDLERRSRLPRRRKALRRWSM